MAQLTGIIHEYYYTQPPNTHRPTLHLHFTPKIIKKDLEYVFLYLFFRKYYKGSDFFRMSYKQAIVFCQTHIEIEKTSIHAKRKEGTGYFIVQLRCMHLSCNRVTELQNNCKNIAGIKLNVYLCTHQIRDLAESKYDKKEKDIHGEESRLREQSSMPDSRYRNFRSDPKYCPAAS